MLKRSTLGVTGVSMLHLSARDFQTPRPARQATPLADEGGKVPPIPKSTLPGATTEADTPVTAVAKPDPASVSAGEAYIVVVDLHIAAGWHIFTIDRPTRPAVPASSPSICPRIGHGMGFPKEESGV
jgi:hypothetical protein